MANPDFTAADLRRGETLFKGPCTFVKGVVDIDGLPRDGKAVSLWANRDEAWTEVAQGIRRAIADFDARRPGVLKVAPASAPQAGSCLPKSAVPASPSAQPVVPTLDRRAVKKAGEALADYLGQVAHDIAEKKSEQARNLGHLYDLLAREIDDRDQREKFLRIKPA